MMSNLITRVLSTLLLIGAIDLMAANPASTKYVQEGQIPTYTVGQYAQGGVIFWITLDGQHGLVASIENMPSGDGTTYEWSPDGSTDTIGAKGNDISMGIGADGNATTTGKINSALIVATYPVGSNPAYAAGVCSGYSHGGYTDWYLPSLAELGLMQSMQSTINTVSMANGGSTMETNTYWSSFEASTNGAWYQDFSNAAQIVGTKNGALLVRAVRAF